MAAADEMDADLDDLPALVDSSDEEGEGDGQGAAARRVASGWLRPLAGAQEGSSSRLRASAPAAVAVAASDVGMGSADEAAAVLPALSRPGVPPGLATAGVAVAGALDCPVCLQLFDDPLVIVGCGHSFCRQCLTQIRDARCPACREWPLRRSE